MTAWTRELTESEQILIAAAREKAWILFAGTRTPHRSCGITMAETFSLGTRPYQALRRGGITGMGPCGAMMGGRIVLGELLGDPDPTAPATGLLKDAVAFYEAELPHRVDVIRSKTTVCNDLTGQFSDFGGPERASFCTRLSHEVATLTAECLIRAGHPVEIATIDGVDFDPANPSEPGPAMPVLPSHVSSYRSVTFTEETVPAGLLRAHTTKAGVWARIVVTEGRLRFRIREGLGGVFLLEPGRDGVAGPEVPHEVAPVGEVAFRVEFCREA